TRCYRDWSSDVCSSDLAVELGINYFDNAPDYGNGVAEENLGRVLKELKLRPVITSKVEVRHTDLGDIAGHVVRSTEESLERLGRSEERRVGKEGRWGGG